MKKIVFAMLVGLFFTNGYSQSNYPKAPKKYKKILFVYEQKSNYTLKDEGVYADTLLLVHDFPNLKFSKVKDPENPDKVCGLMPYSAFFLEEDKKKLIRSVYNDNQIIGGEYLVKNQQTTIFIIRDNKEIREAVKKYFKDYSLKKYTYATIVDYEKGEMTKLLPNMNEGKPAKIDKKEILYENDDYLSGFYKGNIKSLNNTNKVYLNPTLNKIITPEILFSNNAFGVEKITTLSNTCQLMSVSYQEK